MILNKIVDLHTLHIYVHPCNHMLIFFVHMYIYLHTATVYYILSDIYTVWLFFYHIFSEYIMSVRLCVLICVYMCVYIRFHLHTPLTCILPCILAHNFLRNLKHLSTLTHSFQCWLFTCLCVMLCFNMYTPVPVSVLICYDCECACAEYFFYRIHIFFKRSMLSETPQFAGSFQCSQEAFDATDNAIFLSTLDEPSIFLEVFLISLLYYCVLLYCCAILCWAVRASYIVFICMFRLRLYQCLYIFHLFSASAFVMIVVVPVSVSEHVIQLMFVGFVLTKLS